MKLKKFFRKLRIKKWLKSTPKANTYKGFDDVNAIGICFERSTMDKEILEFAASLETKAKKVFLLEYIPLKNKQIEKEAVPTPRSWFGKSHLNFFGEPNNEDIQKYLKRNLDVHIDLITESPHALDFVSIRSRASLKIGSNQRLELPFDLMFSISENNNFDSIFKQIDYYLNFINQRNNGSI